MLWLACVAALGASLDAGAAPRPLFAELAARVQSMGTRDPISTAHVEVDGAEVELDDDARFTLTLSPGEHRVTLSAAGHRPRELIESLGEGERVEVVYRLERSSTPAYQTTVRDVRARTEVARIALSNAEAHEAAGTMGEPLRAVMLLPGVTAVVSGLAYPVVRGTQPAATAYFLDGIRIPQLFHALAGPAVVHPDFIDHLDFFPGVPPSRFGRLLGGAIEAMSSRPDHRVHLTGSIDLINASAFALVPVTATGTSVTAAARGSYTPLLGARLASALAPATPGDPPRNIVADFYDYQVRVEQKLGRTRLRLLAFGSGDEVGTRPNGGEDPTGVFRSLFHRVDLAWTLPLPVGQLELAGTVGHDTAGMNGQQWGMRQFDLDMRRTLGSGRATWSADLSPALALRAGAELEYQTTTSDVSGIGGTLLMRETAESHRAADGLIAGAYLQGRLVQGPAQTLAGVRLDAYQRLGSRLFVSLEPRLEERLQVHQRVAVRAAAGLFGQPATVSLSFPISDLSLLDEGLQWAAHTELGADVSLPLGLELGVTAFYDPLFRALEHPVTSLLFPSGRDPARSGTAYGVELLVRKAAAGRWFGWLAATLQRSERLTVVYRFGADGSPTGTTLAQVPGAFDQTVALHAVVGLKLPLGFTAGLSAHFNTGRPESGEVSSRQMRGELDPASGQRFWVPVDLDQVARLPPFFRLDARLARVFTFDDWTLELYLDVMNASVSREVLAYDYRVSNNQLLRSPLDVPVVLPMLGAKGRY